MKIYKCNICGRIVDEIKAGGPLTCCGQDRTLLVPGTSDGAAEKHVPVAEVTDGKVVVKVGEVEHPMLEEHFIAHNMEQVSEPKEGETMYIIKDS